MILATGAMTAIRHFHPYAELILLTTAPYASLAEQMGLFDHVWIDPRPKFWRVAALQKVLHKLRGNGGPAFRRIYDLQGSDRTACYFYGMGLPKPQWVGKVRGCSHPRGIPDNQKHILDIFDIHLKRLGIPAVPNPTVDWLMGDITKFNLPELYVLLVPSCSIKRPRKRWTVEGYATVIAYLDTIGITSVIVGTDSDDDFVRAILEACSVEPINLLGKTSLGDLASIARQAVFALGSDTGPMHIISATDCPSIVLFSEDSNPALCGPRGEHVDILQVPNLQLLSPTVLIEDKLKQHSQKLFV